MYHRSYISQMVHYHFLIIFKSLFKNKNTAYLWRALRHYWVKIFWAFLVSLDYSLQNCGHFLPIYSRKKMFFARVDKFRTSFQQLFPVLQSLKTLKWKLVPLRWNIFSKKSLIYIFSRRIPCSTSPNNFIPNPPQI